MLLGGQRDQRWTAHAAGPGTQTLTWAVRSGDWMLVAMNADGSRPVNMQVNVAAPLPALPWIAIGLLIGGIIFLAGGILLIVIPVRRACPARFGARIVAHALGGSRKIPRKTGNL